jgi:hypothetical protein
MAPWIQNLVVLLSVGICCAFVARQGFKTLTLRGKGKLGACCAKGCEAHESSNAKPQAAVQFIPSDMLARLKSRR